MKRPLLTVLLLVLALPVAVASLPVKPFTAHYKVYARGIPAGVGVIALRAAGNDRYRMSSALRATGLVRLFLHDQIHEQARGRIVDDRVEPSHYRFQRSGGSKHELNQYTFQWGRDQVIARHDNHQTTLKLAPRVVDPLSLYLQVMSDLSRGLRVNHYSLIDDAKLKTISRQTHRPTDSGHSYRQAPHGAYRASQPRQQSTHGVLVRPSLRLPTGSDQPVQERYGKLPHGDPAGRSGLNRYRRFIHTRWRASVPSGITLWAG